MSRVPIKYVQRWYDKRLGRWRQRLRRNGKRVPLPPIGSAEFWPAYHQALVISEKLNVGEELRSKPGTVSAAIATYYQSRDWEDELSEGTRAMRRPLLERFRERVGHLPLARLEAKFLEIYLGAMKPHAARNMLKALRGFLRHARHDVTRGMPPIRAKSKKHASWPAEAITQYENFHLVGGNARLAFALAKCTGAARAEIARMGPRHLRNGEIVITRQKTGVEATITVLPELQVILDATPVTGLATFLVSRTGKPYSPNDLSEQFRAWCDEAGIAPGLTLHGLRHSLGDQLAERGSSPNEVASVLGHASVKSALHYTQGADRKGMARRAMQRLIEADGG